MREHEECGRNIRVRTAQGKRRGEVRYAYMQTTMYGRMTRTKLREGTKERLAMRICILSCAHEKNEASGIAIP